MHAQSTGARRATAATTACTAPAGTAATCAPYTAVPACVKPYFIPMWPRPSRHSRP
jgi:hypothetical protein